MDIAIIGMSGVFPGAKNIDEFYSNLLNEVDSVGKVLQHRVSANADSFSERGYLENIDEFDYSFFNLSLSEAENMDPHQRMLLELVASAINHAGYSFKEINGANASVILSALGGPKAEYMNLIENFHPTILTGNSYAITAGRISHFFNLTGPSMMIDTSCSSSLVAVHEACNKLRLNECDFAISGGIRLFSNLDQKDKFKFVLDAKEGRCRAFDDKADGIVAGEGGGIVILKPLEKAIRDKDTIHAVIKGSAINQDANRSNGLTAPSPVAQSEVISKAWENSNIDPATVGYIEAHGTGTRLGDPIEIQGLSEAFRKHTNKTSFCKIGSLKSNIGHLGEASGIAGLIKAILSLKNKVFFKTLHYDTPNRFIGFNTSAVKVSASTEKWGSERYEERRIGISSFGMSGTNAHVILEEAPSLKMKESAETDEPYLVTLSAKTEQALNLMKKDLVNHLFNENSYSLQDISFTLNRGRDEYAVKTSLVVSNLNELLLNFKNTKNHDLVSEDVRPIIFLVPNDFTVSENTIKNLINKNSECKQVFDEIINTNYDYTNKKIQKFLHYYVLYTYWTALGIEPYSLIGSGSGNLFIDFITGRESLSATLNKVIENDGESEFNKEKFQEYIHKVNQEVAPIYLSLTVGGELVEELTQVDSTRLVKLKRDDDYSLIVQQSELYNYGAQFNWDKYYKKSTARRINLPTYPFEKTKCWIKDITSSAAEEVTEKVTIETENSPKNAVTSDDNIKQQIHRILKNILKLDQLKHTDDFFEVGGNSLIAISVVEELENHFGVELDYDLFFEYSTVQDLGQHITGLLTRSYMDEDEETETAKAENQIRKIIQDLLKIEELKATDDFFEVGGNSLIAISVVEELENHFGVELDYDLFFEYSTVQDLGQHITGLLTGSHMDEDEETETAKAENQIRKIIQDLLKIEELKATDDFFEVGGNSLIAISVVEELENHFGVELDYDLFFEYSTPKTIAEFVLKQQTNKTETLNNSSELKVKMPKRHYPLSYSQEGMWYLQQLNMENSFYNVPVCLKINENLNIGLLEKSLNVLLQRHSILNTTFPILNGKPYAQINEKPDFQLIVHDLGESSETVLEKKKQEIRDNTLLKAFNLESDLLFRAVVIKSDDLNYELILCMHHIITDDLSYKIFIKELFALYYGYKNEDEINLVPTDYQFTDYAEWQRSTGKEEIAHHVDYWTEKLHGAPEHLTLVIQKKRPQVQTFNGGTKEIKIEKDVLLKMNDFNKAHSSSHFVTLFAAFNTLLFKYSGQEDLVVGFPVAGRKGISANTIGNFVNSLAVRTEIKDELLFSNYLLNLKKEIYKGLKHMDAPFNLIVEQLNLKRSLSHTPIYQVMFDFHNDSSSEELLNSNIDILPLDLQVNTVRCDIEFLLSLNSDNTIDGMVFYNTDIFEHDDIEEFVKHYKALLLNVLNNPNQPIVDLELEENEVNVGKEKPLTFEEDFAF